MSASLRNSIFDQPVTLGDLTGLAFRIFRQRFRQYVSILIFPSFFSSLCLSGIQWSFVHWVEGQSMAIDWFVVHMLASFGCLVVLIFCQWEIALRSVALVRMALLFDTSYNNALAYARRRQWAVMSVYAIGYLAPLFVTVLFIGLFLGTAALGQLGPAGRASSIALGFGEGIGFVVCFSFAVLLTAICFIVIACEDLSVPQAVRRAVSLSMRYRWRGASFISLLCISLFSVCMAFYLPVTMIHIWEAYIQAPSGAFEAPFYLLVIDTAEGTVLSVVSVGVALIGTALYYRDMLLRLEGRDIVERLEKFIENDS